MLPLLPSPHLILCSIQIVFIHSFTTVATSSTKSHSVCVHNIHATSVTYLNQYEALCDNGSLSHRCTAPSPSIAFVFSCELPPCTALNSSKPTPIRPFSSLPITHDHRRHTIPIFRSLFPLPSPPLFFSRFCSDKLPHSVSSMAALCASANLSIEPGNPHPPLSTRMRSFGLFFRPLLFLLRSSVLPLLTHYYYTISYSYVFISFSFPLSAQEEEESSGLDSVFSETRPLSQYFRVLPALRPRRTRTRRVLGSPTCHTERTPTPFHQNCRPIKFSFFLGFFVLFRWSDLFLLPLLRVVQPNHERRVNLGRRFLFPLLQP